MRKIHHVELDMLIREDGGWNTWGKTKQLLEALRGRIKGSVKAAQISTGKKRHLPHSLA